MPAPSVGERLWRGLVALLALFGGARGGPEVAVQKDRLWGDTSWPPPPAPHLLPTDPRRGLAAVVGQRAHCPMPRWRSRHGRPPTCVLMLAWDRVDVAAERLDTMATRLGLALREHLGGHAADLSGQVAAAALLLGRLRMGVAGRAAGWGTASWTTSPSALPPRLAAEMAADATLGREVLAGCRPAMDEMLEAWHRLRPVAHGAGRAAGRAPMAQLAAQIDHALRSIERQATRWAADDPIALPGGDTVPSAAAMPPQEAASPPVGSRVGLRRRHRPPPAGR